MVQGRSQKVPSGPLLTVGFPLLTVKMVILTVAHCETESKCRVKITLSPSLHVLNHLVAPIGWQGSDRQTLCWGLLRSISVSGRYGALVVPMLLDVDCITETQSVL